MKTDLRKTLDGLLTKYPTDLGLLLLRVGIGTIFIWHGLPKILGGPEKWAGLGGVMGLFGVNFAPEFWGLLAAISEFGGGILLIVGLAFRPATLFLAITMTVATSMHLLTGDGMGVASHPLKAAVLFWSFLLIGPGEFSLDRRIAHILFECKETRPIGILRHLYVTCGTK